MSFEKTYKKFMYFVGYVFSKGMKGNTPNQTATFVSPEKPVHSRLVDLTQQEL